MAWDGQKREMERVLICIYGMFVFVFVFGEGEYC